MPATLLVMLGGATGAAARYWTGIAAVRLLGLAFPYGTLAVNLGGGLLMGLLAGTLARLGAGGGEGWRLLLGVGALGGFTTFSAFSLEVGNMALRGDWPLAAGYGLGSVVGAVAMLLAGLGLVRLAA